MARHKLATVPSSIVIGFLASTFGSILSSIPLPTIPWNGPADILLNLSLFFVLPLAGVIGDIAEGYAYMFGVFFGGLYMLYTPLWEFGLLPIGEFVLFWMLVVWKHISGKM